MEAHALSLADYTTLIYQPLLLLFSDSLTSWIRSKTYGPPPQLVSSSFFPYYRFSFFV